MADLSTVEYRSTLGELDLHLIGEGRHERLWEVLGAHPRTLGGEHGAVDGVSFAVWAPNAQGVQVCGDFNDWNGWAYPMRPLGGSGVWELFVPGVRAGARYRYRILDRAGEWHEKADPLAFAADEPPGTASVVFASGHAWSDQEWCAARSSTDWASAPMSIYEVHAGSWRAGLRYRELAEELAAHVAALGFTHVQLLPVAEHPFGGSWGYQVSSYYAPTARYGDPDDFRYLVDLLHRRGIGVILDWVPAHFPRDSWALARFDGEALYEHPDPRRGEHPDWGTLVFDYGRNQVRNFLVASALHWLEEFHVDGLRVDAVASMLYLDYSRPEGQWLPNSAGGRENLEAIAFLRELTGAVHRNHPGALVIAEESTTWPGVTARDGLGFDFKWNMGWMHDTLDYLGRNPVYRAPHQSEMAFSLSYAWSERFVLPLSHDEVVHGKGSLWRRMPGDARQKAAGLRALLAFMWAHPGKQLLFMGSELGQPSEWSETHSLSWHLLRAPLHAGVEEFVAELNRVYRAHPALYTKDIEPAGFSWIAADDTDGNVMSFLRHGEDGSMLACVANFAGIPHRGYRIGLPSAGRWQVVLNTDDPAYGGAGTWSRVDVVADELPLHGLGASVVLDLPASGVLWLVPV
jgi:1,4-alpha-glucan branching enzyme